jgi:hypothetical protein
MEKRDAVIFDYQGTLVDVRGIRHLIDGPGSFDAFHRATVNCLPIPWVLLAAQQAHEDGLAVLVGTGMNEAYRRQTDWWFADHGLYADDLCMRPDGDYRKDFIVKREMLILWRQSYNIIKAYDDNPAVIALWEHEDIPVTVVPGWDGPT